MTDAEGHIVGFVGVQRDITRQKERDRLKDQFVSNVSHELRTPLANILLHIGLLEHGKPAGLPRYLQTLRHEAERLRKMIEDLLDLSRLDRNVTPIQFASIDLEQLLAHLVADRVALGEQRGLTLTYESAPDLPPVLTDASKLIQVASNLLANALNYTPRGGTIKVWAGVRRQEGQNTVTFTARDTGPGIVVPGSPPSVRALLSRSSRPPGRHTWDWLGVGHLTRNHEAVGWAHHGRKRAWLWRDVYRLAANQLTSSQQRLPFRISYPTSSSPTPLFRRRRRSRAWSSSPGTAVMSV